MDLSRVWQVQGVLFLLAITGMLLKRLNIVKSGDKPVLTNLVINVFLPASIIQSFQIAFEPGMVQDFALLIGLSTGSILVSYVISVLLFTKYKYEQRAVLRYGTLISNAGFIGLPVAESFFGSLGFMYASIYIIPIRIALWTVGLAMFTKEKNILTGIRKVAVHPCMVAVYIGVALMVGGIRIVEPVNTTLVMLGKCTTPVIMILVGVIIGELEQPKSMFSLDVVRFTMIRVLLIPGIIFAIVSLLRLDPLVAGISVVMAAMPAGSTTPILAAKYKGDYVLGTKILVLSTLMSLLTIPVWGMLL